MRSALFVGAASTLALACATPPMRVATPPASRSAWLGAGVALHLPSTDRVYFPAGTFTMGSTEGEIREAVLLCAHEPAREACTLRDLEIGANRYIPLMLRLELHAHKVTLSPYFLERREVSVVDYARCVAAGPCAPAAFRPGDERFDDGALPVTHVTFAAAVTYCRWRGGRLPSEAEWERAARGTDGRSFPWGRHYAARRANHGLLASRDDVTDDRDGAALLAPVDAYPDGATPEGVLNLAGNVSEWVADFVDLRREGTGYDKAPRTNPIGAESGEHVVRGGSYRTGAIFLRGAMRAVALGVLYADDIGFRCAYDG